MTNPAIDCPSLLARIAAQFPLGKHSIHGPSHWERVEDWGMRLGAATPGTDIVVVRLFAVFHDSRRLNEHTDPQHGQRGGDLAFQRHGNWFTVDPAHLVLLIAACARHELGEISNDPTIGCCWDADRLDLPRVGMLPNPKLMSTIAGKAWASFGLGLH